MTTPAVDALAGMPNAPTGPEVAAAYARQLEGRPLEEILRWALSTFGDTLALGTSFGKDGLVVLDHLRTLRPSMPVLFLETGYHFPETLALRDRLVTDWHLNVVNLRAKQSVAEQDAEYGPELFRRDPDLCCANRKVAPLRAALLGYRAWLTGVRRDHHAGRAHVPVVEWQELDPDGRGVFKINPMAAWTREQVDAYLQAHALPRHPLWDQGFGSIGCAPCTRKLRAGEAEREGRWSGTGKKECGIHLMGTRAAPEAAS